jgi:hypothetical protein
MYFIFVQNYGCDKKLSTLPKAPSNFTLYLERFFLFNPLEQDIGRGPKYVEIILEGKATRCLHKKYIF